MNDETTTFVNSDTEIHQRLADASLAIELFFRGKEYTYKRQDLPVHIGRNVDECEIVVDVVTASRQHCALIVQHNQIGVLDQSTNGTQISIGRADGVLIKNSFYPLSNRGTIRLGETEKSDLNNLIHFKICQNKEKTA